MNNLEKHFVIKPVLHKNFYKRITFAICFVAIMIIAAAFDGGEFDLGLFVFQIIMFSIIFYIIFRFEYRIIDVDSDCYIYKGLVRKIRVEYQNIDGIDIIEKEVSKNKSYSLLVAEGSEEHYWQISGIQVYRRDELEQLIKRIGYRSNTSNSELSKVIDKLDSVGWLHD